MSSGLLTVGADAPIGDAAREMVARDVLAAVVPSESPGRPDGIVTVRDVVELVAEGANAGETRVRDRFTREAVYAEPGWALERAAGTMVAGRFRHLPVREGGATVGLLSIRDVIRRWLGEQVRHSTTIQIRDAMNPDVPSVDRGATLHEAARLMHERGMGATLVEPARPRRPPELATERVVLGTLAEGADPERVRVGDRLAGGTTFSAPDWSLKQAADAMTRGDFEQVIVVDAHGVMGIITMRDILARWSEERSGRRGS